MLQTSPFDIGRRFILYYQDHGFKSVPRCSLLDPSLPMTFVMSAGRIHIDNAIAHGQYRTGDSYVLLQPCFRHYDVEKVGPNPVHLSLFEMAGAYYFGRVSRESMLRKVWRFLTEELGFRRERLWATYFAGGDVEGYHFEADPEALRALRKIGCLASQIVGLGVEDNLLKQGAGISGKRRFLKCGAMVELFFDRGAQFCCGSTCQPGCKCERFVEISNTLFIYWQFDQVTQSLHPIKTPFTETVIGIERAAMALQEGMSVFDTVGLAALVKLVRSSYHGTAFLNAEQQARSERVIADHIRALLFLVADGAPSPGKCGRQRIVKLLIRGILTHQKILGTLQNNFIQNLINTAFDFYQHQYPHLNSGRSILLNYFDNESKRFEKTLVVALHKLDQVIGSNGNDPINGQQAIGLVKGYGFPLPLLQQRLHSRGIHLNEYEYHEAYAHWRQKGHNKRR